MPDDGDARAVRDESGREEHGVVQVHERRLQLAQQPPQRANVRGDPRQFSERDEPAKPAVLHVPRMREGRDRRAVHSRAHCLEELGGVTAGHDDMGFPFLAESADQKREASGGSARLRTVMDEENALCAQEPWMCSGSYP